MLISLCVPVMNRVHDLALAMPRMLRVAGHSPPAEIAVLDYNSSDGLSEYVESVQRARTDARIVYNRYVKRAYYHMAHAYNLAALSASGEYLVIMGADAILAPEYLAEVRKRIDEGCVWMRGPHYKGIVCVQRVEFIAAGGYDERFEFYGSEDRDLEARLVRRGGTFGLLPDGLVRTLRTSNEDKVRNYRGGMDKGQMIAHNRVILAENNRRGVLVANEGREWGSWQS